MTLHKYPRTRHLEGSRLQAGDHDLDSVPFSELRGRHLVVSEKLDGANAALSFDDNGVLYLQSRGHFLTGGPREKHFTLFKQWAQTHAQDLSSALGANRVLYGEWMFARHTIFYDRLPHYFITYDILDTQTGQFLASAACRAILAGTPAYYLEPIHGGPVASLDDLLAMAGPSAFKSRDWRERLSREALARGLEWDLVWKETDKTDLMEGLYITVEEEGRVVERFKWVRAGFLQAVVDSESHWLRRPIIPNGLADATAAPGEMTQPAPM